MPTGSSQTAPPALVSLPPIEVFQAGDFGAKGKYTTSDLSRIAGAYAPDKHEAPITTDHEKSGPAHGWVKGLSVKGDKLFAETEVTAEFADAIRERRFPKRSIELYPEAEFADGQTYLKRLTFLGAKIPHVKGMRDPEFSDESDAHEISFDEPEGCTFLAFTEEPAPPAGASHDTIVRQHDTFTNLEHWHRVYVDGDGNGFTGPPLIWDSSWDVVASASDTHQHLVEGGKIQPAESALGVDHTHGDFDFSETETGKPNNKKREFSAPERPQKPHGNRVPTGDPSMTTTTDPKTPKEDVNFAEENKALRARVGKLEQENADREFDEAVRNASEKISPGSLKAGKAIFDALPSGEDNQVEFSEGNPIPIKSAFLKFMEGLEPAPPKGVKVAGDPNDVTREPVTDPEAKSKTEFEEAEKLAKEENISFDEAAAQIRNKKK